jgi:hypothetical protein
MKSRDQPCIRQARARAQAPAVILLVADGGGDKESRTSTLRSWLSLVPCLVQLHGTVGRGQGTDLVTWNVGSRCGMRRLWRAGSRMRPRENQVWTWRLTSDGPRILMQWPPPCHSGGQRRRTQFMAWASAAVPARR